MQNEKSMPLYHSASSCLDMVFLLFIIPCLLFFGCAPAGDSAWVPKTRTGRSSVAPTSGKLTILLAQLTQSERTYLAQELRQQAQSLLPDEPVWLENNEQGLSINYGRFLNYKQAEKALKKVRQIYPQLRAGPYQFCYIKEIPQPDPEAPGEWSLLNSNCYYSLEIAAYYNIPEKNYYNRKADAVQAVRNLRQSGQTAYFVHGKHESRVYIGCFPASVLQQQVQENRLVEIIHPMVKVLLEKYPYHENGQKITNIRHDKKNRTIRIPSHGKLVRLDDLR